MTSGESCYSGPSVFIIECEREEGELWILTLSSILAQRLGDSTGEEKATFIPNAMLNHTNDATNYSISLRLKQSVYQSEKDQELTLIFPFRIFISSNLFLSSSNFLSKSICLSFLFSLDWNR